MIKKIKEFISDFIFDTVVYHELRKRNMYAVKINKICNVNATFKTVQWGIDQVKNKINEDCKDDALLYLECLVSHIDNNLIDYNKDVY